MAGEGGPVEVNIGACQCPGTPHESDTVWLRAKPDLNMGLAVQTALRQSGNLLGDTETAVLAVLIRYGVAAWNVRDADGAVRVTTDAVADRLGWGDSAMRVALEARKLYWDTVLAPLVRAKSEQAQPMPRTDSTSASQASSPHTRSSSARSSHSEQEAGKP